MHYCTGVPLGRPPGRPARHTFDNRFVLIDPGLHPGKAMGQRVQHIGYKQNRQLTITEPGPVAMSCKDIVNHRLNTHLLKKPNDERYRVDSLYFWGHHKPPGYEFYDDHDMTGLDCSEQISPLIRK